MLKRRINIVILAVIILCSVSFYELSFLGSAMQKMAEILGGGIIFVLILFHLVYSNQKGIKRNFSVALLFILLSLITSMITSYAARDQRIVHTMFAQRAMYYYLLYFLLHQLKFEPKDMEKVFVFFAVVYMGMHFLQTALYPRLITDGTVRAERGTVRIYIEGADYIALAFLLYLQKFLRSNNLKYLLLIFLVIAIYVMRGGRSAIAIQTLTVVLFVIIDRKVQSRIFLVMLGLIGSIAIFFIFQDIFGELVNQSKTDMAKGEDYIRLKAIRYYMTEFNESHPIAYITGNGKAYPHSNYGKLIRLTTLKYRYYLSDIGLFGNYVFYGLFFIIGVLGICIRLLKLKIDPGQSYVKYYFIAVIIGITTSAAFAEADFICMMVCLLYLVDTSNDASLKNRESRLENSTPKIKSTIMQKA